MILENYPLKSLQKIYKTEDNSNVRERLQILIYLKEDRNQRNVADLLMISLGKVSFWKQRFEKHEFNGLKDKKGRGRKPRLNKKELQKLDSEITNGIKMKDGYKRGYKTKDAKQYIKNNFNIEFTSRHCRRILRNLRFRLKVPRPRNKSRNQYNVDEFKQEFKKKLLVWKKER